MLRGFATGAGSEAGIGAAAPTKLTLMRARSGVFAAPIPSSTRQTSLWYAARAISSQMGSFGDPEIA